MQFRLPHTLPIFALLLLRLTFGSELFAQQLPGQNAWFIEPSPQTPVDATQLAKEQSSGSDWWTGFDVRLNYSELNQDNRHVIYMLNSRFPYTGKNDLKSATVAFNRIVDEFGTEYNFLPTSQMMVDTVYLWIGHENNSNKNDTMVIDVLHTDSLTGYPTEQFLNYRTIITNRSITNPTINDWRFGAAVVKIHAGNLVGMNRKFAVRVRYYGSFLDTFGVVMGFRNEGACTKPNIQSPAVSTLKSNYYPNSYRDLTDVAAVYPTAAGIDLFRDCNNNNVIDTLANEWHLQQNMNLWVLMRYDSFSVVPAGVRPLADASPIILYPNPGSGKIQLEYLGNAELEGWMIRDLQGKLVYEAYFEETSLKQHQADLSQLPIGVYVAEVKTREGSFFSRLILK
jgi:hypothetical protein